MTVQLILRVGGSEALYLSAFPKKGAEGTFLVQAKPPGGLGNGKMKTLGEVEFDESEGMGAFAKKMLVLLEEVSGQ